MTDIGKPSFCELLISEKCNLRCKACYFWKYGLKDELTIEECKSLIDSLAGWVDTPSFEVNLAGGEPLLKKGILDLAHYCVKRGLCPTMATNATLIDEEMAKRISDVGFHRLALSLKSLNENTHDFLMGVKGSYKSLMRALEYLRKYWHGGDLNINTIILEQNIEEILGMVEWVNKDDLFTGISFQALAQPFRTDLIDRWYSESEYSFLWPKDSKEIASLIDTLIQKKISGYKILNPLPQLIVYKRYYNEPWEFARMHHCNFGNHILNVNALGLVHLCCFKEPVGTIKETGIKDIWRSEEARNTRISMHNCQKSCNNIVNCYFQKEEDETQKAFQMVIEDMKSDSEKSEAPLVPLTSCDILMSNSCSLKCKMCYLWKCKRDPKEMNLDEWKFLICSLQKFIISEPVRLHFGGGEPFLNNGILDLIELAAEKGFTVITTSNGYLIDKTIADRILNSGLGHIAFSLDSLNEDVHDYLRGVKGSQARVIKAIEYLYNGQTKPSIGINCIISDINLDGILPLANWAVNDERIKGIIFQAVVQPYETALEDEWYKKEVFSGLWPKDLNKVNYVIDKLIELKAKGCNKMTNSIVQLKSFKEYFQDPLNVIEKRKCPMDRSSVLVNWRGEVHLCGLLHDIGNLRDNTIGEVLSSKKAADRLNEMKNCSKNCNNKVNCFFKEEE